MEMTSFWGFEKLTAKWLRSFSSLPRGVRDYRLAVNTFGYRLISGPSGSSDSCLGPAGLERPRRKRRGGERRRGRKIMRERTSGALDGDLARLDVNLDCWRIQVSMHPNACHFCSVRAHPQSERLSISTPKPARGVIPKCDLPSDMSFGSSVVGSVARCAIRTESAVAATYLPRESQGSPRSECTSFWRIGGRAKSALGEVEACRENAGQSATRRSSSSFSLLRSGDVQKKS